MKFDSKLIEILQNFSSINNSMIFRQGDVISTISQRKQVVARAKVAEPFPVEFGVFNLSQLLAILSALDDAEVEFLDNKMLIKSGSKDTMKYGYSEMSLIISPPEKGIKFPEPDITFKLPLESFKKLLKLAAISQLPEIAIVGDGETLSAVAVNVKNPNDNSFQTALGETDKKFRLVFLAENLNLLPRDYDVEITKKGLGHFSTDDVEYLVSTEANHSTFEG